MLIYDIYIILEVINHNKTQQTMNCVHNFLDGLLEGDGLSSGAISFLAITINISILKDLSSKYLL